MVCGFIVGEIIVLGGVLLAANFIPDKTVRKLLKGYEAFVTAIQEENAREAEGANQVEATQEESQKGQGEANEANEDDEEEGEEENERTGLLTGEANVWPTGDSEHEGPATSESQENGQTDEPEYRELVFVDPLEYYARAEERRLCLERQIEVNRFEMNWMYCIVDRENTELKNQIIDKDRKIRELEQMGDDKAKECSLLLLQNTSLVQAVGELLLRSQPTAAYTDMDTGDIPGPSASGGCETEKAKSVCGKEEAATQLQASEALTGTAGTKSNSTGPMRPAPSEIEGTGLVRLSGKTDYVQREFEPSTGDGIRKAKKVVNVGVTADNNCNTTASASSSSAPSAAAALDHTEDEQRQEITPKAETRSCRKRISNVGMKSSRGRE
ncbi:unnamed protein product [Vitrella brassicaformis CCMP3155]|uniref:Uncharacterized protein n=2 Tax=Vitrella brassicaformis TaxID=1169539 RepID=A0A0G4EZJ8_VITBC|nr:unnamed protein product [Vitrella brassicaformis CCMP3155]|eukprot:CEM04434.1 unnamed protein product [Vitrella brassicaformis CCMP3155]